MQEEISLIQNNYLIKYTSIMVVHKIKNYNKSTLKLGITNFQFDVWKCRI